MYYNETVRLSHGAKARKGANMAVIQVNEQNYQEVVNGGKTVFLDLYADWCGPCRRMAPLVERLAADHPELAVGKVNVEEEQGLAEKFGVMSIPMFVVIKDGRIAARNVGAVDYEVIEKMATEA